MQVGVAAWQGRAGQARSAAHACMWRAPLFVCLFRWLGCSGELGGWCRHCRQRSAAGRGRGAPMQSRIARSRVEDAVARLEGGEQGAQVLRNDGRAVNAMGKAAAVGGFPVPASMCLHMEGQQVQCPHCAPLSAFCTSRFWTCDLQLVQTDRPTSNRSTRSRPSCKRATR